MNINKLLINDKKYPLRLRNIPSPPEALYHMGKDLPDLLERKVLAIVGSRRPTVYGRRVTIDLARDLAEQGITIISGLALGIDGIAHRAALEVGGTCIAVLPSPFDNIVPANNRRLADDILAGGGALVSEYPPGDTPYKQNFIVRNRIVSGLADAVLVTEASEKSGTTHTVRFARDQNRDVMSVPGNVTLASHVGSNNFIKTGAVLVTSYKDVLNALGMPDHQTAARAVKGRNANEQMLLNLMLKGISGADELLEASRLNVGDFNVALTMLEVGGKIRPLGMNHWAIF